MALVQNFRDNLAEAIARLGINQLELSKRSGIHQVTISRVLTGKIEPSVSLCERLAEAAQMHPEAAFLTPPTK